MHVNLHFTLCCVLTVVCKVELTSGFSTSLVNQPGPVKFDQKSHQTQPDCSGKGIDLGMLYGAFQLSNRVACTDASTASLDLCQMPCTGEYLKPQQAGLKQKLNLVSLV